MVFFFFFPSLLDSRSRGGEGGGERDLELGFVWNRADNRESEVTDTYTPPATARVYRRVETKPFPGKRYRHT